jgi:membrane associated rhomboid family serine protease
MSDHDALLTLLPPITAALKRGPLVVKLLIACNVVCFPSLDDAAVYGTHRRHYTPRRWLTAVFAHGDLLHLAHNMAALAVVGPAVHRALRLSSARFLILYAVSAFVSECASLGWRVFTRSDSYSVGASGAISGLLSALGMLRPHEAEHLLGTNRSIHPLAQIMLNVVVDLATSLQTGRNLDIAGHAGGALAGYVVAWAHTRRWAW